MRIFLFGVLAVFSLWSVGAADLDWQTDLPKAQAQAKAEKKLILLDFTGSDWCESCQILAGKTFDQPEFAAFARTNLVLVEVDFPLKKLQSDALKTANQALTNQFKVEGYPTLIALKPDGTVAWRNTDAPIIGPGELIEKLNEAKRP